jgi:LAO/AO transport system kinase
MELFIAAGGGDRAALGRLVSASEAHGEDAVVIDGLVTQANAAGAATGRRRPPVVGITGPPGAGKSTLVDRLVAAQRAADQTVGVLAIDPSSPYSGGAILGDRVRMGSHLGDDGVFIRSLATRGAMGGLAVAVSSILRLLSVMGFDELVIETVGVGQVELDVATVADTVVVVVAPGWGDEVQAAKAGLMEIADIFVVNKSDRPGAAQTAADLTAMASLAQPAAHGWRPIVVTSSALTGAGVNDLVEAIALHRKFLSGTGAGVARDHKRAEKELVANVGHVVSEQVAALCSGAEWDALVAAVLAGRVSPKEAAATMLSSQRHRLFE